MGAASGTQFLKDKGVVVDAAYQDSTMDTPLILTTSWHTIDNWVDVTVLGITDNLGVFTYLHKGIYKTDLQRIYINTERSPISPYKVYIRIVKNGDTANPVFERDAIIGAATATDEPGVLSFTTPFIGEVEAGDTFEMQVKATEGASGSTNGSVILDFIKKTVEKIREV